MATYKEIQIYVKNKYGFVPKTCWIADVNSKCALIVNKAPIRKDPYIRKFPCPPDTYEKIKEQCQV